MNLRILLLIFMPLVIGHYTYGQKTIKKVTITGTVVDLTHKPVSDAIILIDNKQSGRTNAKGVYKVKASPDAVSISVFSILDGIKEQEIDNRTEINFTLSKTSKAIQETKNNSNEEVISDGYSTVKKDNSIMTVNKLKVTDNKYASYKNVYEMIKGEVPGVQINGSKISIRGQSSLRLTSDPLFIVDGISVSSISDIQPSQVKSLEVLKGASTSIYGSRGTNGVIIINLK